MDRIPSTKASAVSLPVVRELAAGPDPGTKPTFLRRDGHQIATYRSTRLDFRRDVIEQLPKAGILVIRIAPRGGDHFSVAITPEEFERDFPRILLSKSWQDIRRYHHPTFPKRASAFVVDLQAAPQPVLRARPKQRRLKRNESLVRLMQNRVAGAAIGPSTLRNQGSSGVVARAREHLKGINLRHFAVHSRPDFSRQLDAETARLKKALPPKGRSWGAARKALNIFLRDVLYHRLLCEFYDLQSLERWLEIPLDSQVAKGICLEAPEVDLPKWPGVKHVTPEESSVYQAAAALIASKEAIARVHLDLRWWRPEAMPGRRA